MQQADADLFGMPRLDAEQSQWMTPPWLARRLASWVPRGARVLEPSCGTGNLLQALLSNGHDAKLLLGVERDDRLADHAYERFMGLVSVWKGDFLALDFGKRRFDYVLMNPPFEGNAHMHFVLRALELAPVVVGVFPVAFRFGGERDRVLWAQAGAVTHVALMPERVDYGGDQSGKFDSVALRIMRREHPRIAETRAQVFEEVWRP